jgi:hypothetical protein
MEDAAAFVSRLQAEGFTVPWSPEYGGRRIAIGAQAPETAPCTLVLWTKDAPTSRWVREYAMEAHKRNSLVEVLVEPTLSPIESSVPPIDFSEVADAKTEARLWKELIARIEAKTGEPNGRLPMRKELRPVAAVTMFGSAIALTIVTMPGLQPSSDGLITPQQTAQKPIAEMALAQGGPMVSPTELATREMAPVRVKFRPTLRGVEAVMRVRVVTDPSLISEDEAVVYRLVDLSDLTVS